MKPRYRIIKGKKHLFLDNYTVRECGSNYYGIYDEDGILITHRETFKTACKIAKLLDKAYLDGYNKALW